MAGIDLMTDAERAEARAAFRNLEATFAKTPIEIYRVREGLDIYQEDKGDVLIEKYVMTCLTEYASKESDEMDKTPDGSWDFNKVNATLWVDTIEESGLLNADMMFTLVEEKDFFRCKGQLYKIIHAYLDGPLENKAVLLILRGIVIPPPAYDFETATQIYPAP